MSAAKNRRSGDVLVIGDIDAKAERRARIAQSPLSEADKALAAKPPKITSKHVGRFVRLWFADVAPEWALLVAEPRDVESDCMIMVMYQDGSVDDLILADQVLEVSEHRPQWPG